MCSHVRERECRRLSCPEPLIPVLRSLANSPAGTSFQNCSCSQWRSQCSPHTTVALFLAGYIPPSRFDLLNYLQQTGGTIAGLFVTHQDDNHVRDLTLLGEDAEKMSSFLTHCFNCQLACGTDELHYECVSLTA